MFVAAVTLLRKHLFFKIALLQYFCLFFYIPIISLVLSILCKKEKLWMMMTSMTLMMIMMTSLSRHLDMEEQKHVSDVII